MCISSFSFNRLLAATFLLLFITAAVNAYTLVLYGGKRMEIPAKFVVTTTAVTYEVWPGMNITVELATIDAAATERVNNEPAGSFLRRVQTANTSNEVPNGYSQTHNTGAARTITNQDLERSERARLESERVYEKRRQELGLPSLEESRRRAKREEVELDEIIARQKQEESENYWRERQAELQAEMAAGRINALNSAYAEPYWPDGFIAIDNGMFGPVGSRFRFGFHRRFPFGFNQGSPCGFNPSASCLLSHSFPSGFNQQFSPRHRMIFVAPGANVSGHRFGGGVFVNPGGRH